MQFGITWNDCAEERPALRLFYQFSADWICQDVETGFLRRRSIFFLPRAGRGRAADVENDEGSMLCQDAHAKFHAIPLVGIAPQSHPEQMNVVGHQAIGRAE